MDLPENQIKPKPVIFPLADFLKDARRCVFAIRVASSHHDCQTSPWKAAFAQEGKQGHGLHMDKLSAFLSLSNCCFVVTGTALVSPGMIIEGSLNGLVKARLALSCSVLELGTGKTEQPSPCQIGLGDISPEMAVTKHCTTPLLPLNRFLLTP